MKLKSVSCKMWYENRRVILTLAPILPFIVITAPMIELPSTRAPIANLQLSPLAIMDDAGCDISDCAHTIAPLRNAKLLTNLPVAYSPAIGHPVGKERRASPCALRGRHRIEISIGSCSSPGKRAGLLVDRKRKVETTLW
jgi:hypothetical protein